MCGLAGFVGAGDRDILTAMTDCLSHRGPDSGVVEFDADRRIGFGHRRLSVLDHAGGTQPMWNAEGDICVIYNGEIYNHHELRRELEAAGHGFRSDHSDTEVLVHGYRAWGERLPERLNGMFAFAVLDLARNKVFVARDHLGKKPLFYSLTDGCFAFASEVTALLRHPRVDSSIDLMAVRKLFAYSFLPAPFTLYRGARKLPAGSWARYDCWTGSFETARYWHFELDPAPEDGCDRSEELVDILDRSVHRRLEADVPLGILLSGGLDSGAVLALASRHRDEGDVDTFTMGFEEASFDERQPAADVASLFRSRHHETVCSFDSLIDNLPAILGRLDDPILDSSILPTWALCRFTREHVTVALTGDGGDELFAGYDTFKALAASSKLSAVAPAALRRSMSWLADAVPYASERNMSLDFKVRRWLRGVQYQPALWNPAWLGALAADELDDLFGEKLAPEELYGEVLASIGRRGYTTPMEMAQDYYMNFYLPENILVKADRASMAHGLELRSPFLDLEMIDFARRLPLSDKFHEGAGKQVLRRACARLLPERIINRPKKGFGSPIAKYLRHLDKPSAAPSMVNHDVLERYWHRHRSRRADFRHALWAWFVLDQAHPGTTTGAPGDNGVERQVS